MRLFNFANLLPGGRKATPGHTAAEGEPDPDEAMEDDEETPSDDEETPSDDEDTPSDGEEEDSPPDDGDEEDEASAYARGRRAERRRIGAILSSAAVNAANLAQAMHIACNTALKPDAAAEILKTAPAQPAGPGLAAAMRGRGPAPLTPSADVGGGGGTARGPSQAELMKARFARK